MCVLVIGSVRCWRDQNRTWSRVDIVELTADGCGTHRRRADTCHHQDKHDNSTDGASDAEPALHAECSSLLRLQVRLRGSSNFEIAAQRKARKPCSGMSTALRPTSELQTSRELPVMHPRSSAHLLLPVAVHLGSVWCQHHKLVKLAVNEADASEQHI